MSDADLGYLTAQALVLTLWLSLPAVAAATAIGLLVGLLQALTQIQEQTLPLALKLAGVLVTLIVAGSWMGAELFDFTIEIFEKIPFVS